MPHACRHTHTAVINATGVNRVYKDRWEEIAQRRSSTSPSPCAVYTSTYICRECNKTLHFHWCAVKWAKGYIQYESRTELPFRDHFTGQTSTRDSVVLDQNLETVRSRGHASCSGRGNRRKTSWRKTLRFKRRYWSCITHVITVMFE